MSEASLWLSIFLAGAMICGLLNRRLRLTERRLGWQAYQDGLPFRSKWSKDVQAGWLMAANERARP